MKSKRLLNFLFTGCLMACLMMASAARSSAGEENAMTERIRESVIAGSWYPGDEQTLRKTVQGYLNNVPEPVMPGKLIALISPHAGYIYSGQVAAYAYKLLEKQKFESVIVIAPSHRAYFHGVSVYNLGGFRTPLGVAPIDKDLIAALEKRDSRIRYIAEAHAQEHSLEIQLPFLQVVMPGFKLVPLVIGDQNVATCQWLAEAIADTIQDKSVLIVASSDLSHFHSGDEAKKLDGIVQEKVKNFDPEGLNQSLTKRESEACGGGPIIVAMLAAKRLGATKTQVLKYAHSGDITGDHHRVVGYMAAAIWNNPGTSDTPDSLPKTDEPTHRKAGIDLGLTAEEKQILHQVVKETIEARLQGKPLKKYEASTPTLKELRGAFVTLHKHGQLRGCIGNMIGQYPLIETISKMAVAAAFEDPRFPPVKPSEFNELDIEISVLTPLKKISDVNEIQVGTHGIYMKKGFSSGVLLPQVATEYGWDRITFLQQTCRKAGLPLDAWKDPHTEIFIFSADIF